MKKIIKSIFLICLSFIMLIPTVAYAEDKNVPEWEDVTLTEKEFNEILAPYVVDNTKTRASGLITAYGMAISKSGSKLLIAGKTYGNADVTKCGFTQVIVQRRKNSDYSWSTYASFYDLYSNSTVYSLTKKLTPPSGYQYRVTCTHYARENIFSTEKIDNISNIVTM